MNWITRQSVAYLSALVASTAWGQSQDTVITFTYDSLGNVKSVNRPLGRTTSFSYDALSRVTQENITVGSSTLIIQPSYDGLDQVTSVKDPRNFVTNYTIDGLGNRTQLSSPDTQTSNYTLDEAGNVLTSTDARGKTTQFQYDALGRILQAQYQSGVPSQFEYDGGAGGPVAEIGNLTKITDESGTTTFTHDMKRRVLTKNQVVNVSGTNSQFSVQYIYGTSGRAVSKLQSIIYPSGARVNYNYDDYGRVGGVTLNQPNGSEISLLANVAYTSTGNIQSWQWGNSALPLYQRTYDIDGRLTSYPVDLSGTIRTVTYNAASLVTAYSHAGGANPAQFDQSFSYDTADRLTSFSINGVTTTFTYDTDGNRTQQTGPNVTYNYSTTNNRLNSVAFANQRIYTYDSAGNRIGNGRDTYTYSDRGRLAQVRGSATLDMYYNALEQRVQKVSVAGHTAYVYDEKGHTIGEYAIEANAATETIYLGELPIAVVTAQGTFYVIADHISAPLMLAQSDGKVVWDWRNRDPFGNNTPISSPALPAYDHRFPGQVADIETGLFYNYFRDYDPQTGRYVQSDPIGQDGGINTYAYVGGDPINDSDPYGLKRPANSAHCTALREKLQRKNDKLDERYDEYTLDRQRLPERVSPSEALEASRRGHRTLINMEDSSLRKLEKRYRNECEDEPPPPPAPKECPANSKENVTLKNTAKALTGAGALYWIISEGSRLFPPRNFIPIP